MYRVEWNDTLKHHGVLGMHWGVRKATGRSASRDHIRSRKLKKKPLHELSNDELKELNKRLNLEANYKNLNPNLMKKGRKIATEITTTIGAFGGLYALSRTPAAGAVKGMIMSKIKK